MKKAAGGGAEVTDTGEEDDPTSGGLWGILVRALFRTENYIGKEYRESKRVTGYVFFGFLSKRWLAIKTSGIHTQSQIMTIWISFSQ